MAPPNWKIKPWRSKKYMEWVSSQPCCIIGTPGPNDPHHENIPGHGTMGGKCGDDRCVPLAHHLHVEMETPGNSREAFWKKYRKDPDKIIGALNAKFIREGGKMP